MKRIALIAIMAGVLLCGCGENTNMKFKYDHPDRYKVGDAVISQPVKKISIDWYSGGIDIRYADGQDFIISEESDSIPNDSLYMRYYLSDDGKLDIQFCQSGNYRYGQLERQNKRLSIKVPHEAKLDEIEIDMVEGLVCIDSVYSRELSLDVVDVATTIWTPTLADEIDVDAVKSTLRLFVSPSTGMTIDMNGVSNEFDCGLPVHKEGRKTIIGDGRCKVDFDAVKGSLFINEIPKQ